MNNCGTKLPLKTRRAIESHLSDVPPSTERSQLIKILNYRLEGSETIAERFLRDHSSSLHAYRQAQLLVDAGAASTAKVTRRVHCGNGEFKEKEMRPKIIFEDGSEL